MQLRPYQRDACNAIVKELSKDDIRSTFVVCPTGTGKTPIICGVGRYFAFSTAGGRHPCRVLVLAHQNMLIEQAAEKFSNILGIKVNEEKGSKTCIGSEQPITVATVQTMARRLDRFDPDYFGLIIVDESHHIMSPSYQKVMNHFKEAKVLGVTATPDRADGKKINRFFQSLAFTYTIKQAQEDGYLSPMKIKRAALKINLNKVKKVRGDFDDRALGMAIEPYLHEIAEEVRKLGKGRKIVCFVPLIRTAKKAAEIFSHYGFRSAWTAGNDKEKKEKLEAFDRGDYDIMFNSMLLTEGWDCPSVDCVIILRPTTSRALYVQMLGRGLRLSPGKKDCLLIDFLFQHDRFDLATPEDIMEPEKPPGPPGERPGPGGVGDREDSLLKQAKLAKEEELRIRAMRDPFTDPSIKYILERYYKPSTDLREEEIEKKQKEALEKRNICWLDLNYTQANILIRYIDGSRPLTTRQAYFLRHHGFAYEQIKDVTFSEAKRMIGSIKARERNERW